MLRRRKQSVKEKQALSDKINDKERKLRTKKYAGLLPAALDFLGEQLE
jgi:hypothetical protein